MNEISALYWDIQDLKPQAEDWKREAANPWSSPKFRLEALAIFGAFKDEIEYKDKILGSLLEANASN